MLYAPDEAMSRVRTGVEVEAVLEGGANTAVLEGVCRGG